MALIFCPDCGKQVSEHARACPNCGYPIGEITSRIEKETSTEQPTHAKNGSTVATNSQSSTNTISKKRPRAVPAGLAAFHKVFFIISLIATIILYLCTLNRYNYSEVMIEILVGIGLVILLVVLFKKGYDHSKSITIVSLCLSATVLALLIGANVLHSSKLAYAKNHPSSSKEFCLIVHMDVEFYSEENAGKSIRNPSCSMSIDGQYLNDGDSIKATLDKSKIQRIGCSFGYTGSANHDGGWNDKDEPITSEMIDRPLVETVIISDDIYAEIQYSFERVLSFWEVVFA